LITAASRRALVTDSFPSATAASVSGILRRSPASLASRNDPVRVMSVRARIQQAKE